MSIDWNAKRRELLLDQSIIQLNAGTLSPTPRVVFDAQQQHRIRNAEAPTAFGFGDAWQIIAQSRAALARYLNVREIDLAFQPNVTVAINAAVMSISLPRGSEILTTAHEYGAMLTLWSRVAAERGWTIRVLDFSGPCDRSDQLVGEFERSISAKTRAIFFSHVTSPTGLIFPAKEIAKLARERGLLSIIDGAHGPGHVPTDLAAIDADVYAANCHKWLMSPAACGFLHVSPRLRAAIRGPITSWGHGWNSDNLDQPGELFKGLSRWQTDHEFDGTTDFSARMVIPEALAFRESLGGDHAIAARCDELRKHLRAKLVEVGLSPVFANDPGLSLAMTVVELRASTDGHALRKRLMDEFKIECPVTFVGPRKFLRISTAWWNTPDELDAVCAALHKLGIAGV